MRVSKKCVIFFAYVALLGSAASAAEPQRRLTIYNNDIKAHESGVYEVDGDLYVHVRLSDVKAGRTNALKMKAFSMANDMLRKWAIDYSAKERQSAISDGVAFKRLVAVLDGANPLWRFSDWNVKFSGQENWGVDDSNNLWFVQCAPKDDIVRQIPESFRKAIPDKHHTLNMARLLLPQMLASSPNRTYTACGVVDCRDGILVDDETRGEHEKCILMINDYLSSSPTAAHMKRVEAKLREGKVTDFWDYASCEICVSTNTVETIVTNTINDATIAVVLGEKSQDAASREEFGIALGGTFKTRREESFPEKISITRVITVTETTVKTRRHVVEHASGTPRFEELFLSGGTMPNEPAKRIPSGDEAIRKYFKGMVSLDELNHTLHDALCENPADADLWNLYGRLLEMGNDKIGAMICFKNALRLEPSHQYALVNAAMAYRNLGFERLSTGLAILGVALAEDKWCRDKAEELLDLEK